MSSEWTLAISTWWVVADLVLKIFEFYKEREGKFCPYWGWEFFTFFSIVKWTALAVPVTMARYSLGVMYCWSQVLLFWELDSIEVGMHRRKLLASLVLGVIQLFNLLPWLV